MRLRWLLLTVLLLLLLVPAGAVSYARLLDPVGGTWVRLVAFTPLATVLYAVALLLVLLAAWRTSGGWRTLHRVLAVGCVLAVLVHVGLDAKPFLGGSPAEAAGPDALRVMTANLELGGADASRVVEAAVAHGVDVLVLEEVTPEELGRMEAAGLSTAYPHRAGRAEAGPAGTMVLSTHRLSHARRLATRFGSWQVDVRTGGGVVHLLAVHVRPPLDDARDWTADQGVVRETAVGLHGPTLLVGDFNATLDHRPLRELAGRGFTDAVVQARSRWQPTWPSAGKVRIAGVAVPSLLQLDHVFVGEGLRARSTTSVTLDGTDHRAVVAVVSR